MLINERDERLIQKCVDEELSSEETRALLKRLDSLDNGWKFLACGLLEDRNLRRSLRLSDADAVASLPPVVPPRNLRPVGAAATARSNVRHWWSHPMTSMALCAAIAFVGGILIPDLRPGNSRTVTSAGIPGILPGNSTNPSALPAMQSGELPYRLQMTPGGQMVDVPVYPQPDDLYRKDRDNPLFSTSGNGQGMQVQWWLVPVEKNRSMLIPVSEDSQLDMQ